MPFESVASNVKSTLRNDMLLQMRDEKINQLRNKYSIIYNERLLEDISDQLNEEKQKKGPLSGN